MIQQCANHERVVNSQWKWICQTNKRGVWKTKSLGAEFPTDLSLWIHILYNQRILDSWSILTNLIVLIESLKLWMKSNLPTNSLITSYISRVKWCLLLKKSLQVLLHLIYRGLILYNQCHGREHLSKSRDGKWPNVRTLLWLISLSGHNRARYPYESAGVRCVIKENTLHFWRSCVKCWIWNPLLNLVLHDIERSILYLFIT